MRILVTGAFGGIGTEVIRQGLDRGYAVSVFELNNKRNQKIAGKFEGRVSNIFWGDLRNFSDVYHAVLNQDVVIHLGALIPPLSEKNRELSNQVNIYGTQNIIQSITKNGNRTKLVFTSSMEIMKYFEDRVPPIKVTDPVEATSNYTAQKIECEKRLIDSGIHWVVCRLGAVINTELSAGGGSLTEMFDKVFELSLNSRIEGVWNIDAARALLEAASLMHRDCLPGGKVFFIGGGSEKGWQLTVREFYTGIFNSIGFGMFNEKYFSAKPYNSDWLDTAEGQMLFDYQNHTFTEFQQAMRKKMGILGLIIRLFARPARLILQGYSKNKM